MGYIIDEVTPYVDPHSRGTGSIVTQRKGYILRTRGEHNRLVRHDYECPVHGVFEAMVPSGEVPTTRQCEADVTWMDPVDVSDAAAGRVARVRSCGFPSPYRVPTVAQGFAAGSVKC